jgi:hypothetical protein
MTPQQIVLAMLEAVEKTGFDYVIVGALAANAYSFARATKDVDFVLSVGMSGIESLAVHLPANFIIDPQPRMELSTGTHRWIIQVPGADFYAEVFHLGDDPHHREEFARRRKMLLPSIAREAWIPAAEDLVIQKLRWGRAKDLDDARNILSVQAGALDFPYLESWCDRHGTRGKLEEVRRSIPEI